VSHLDNYPFRCPECGRFGTEDDGIEGVGDECPDEDCDGIIVSNDGAG
jgi:hypothetical protein